uniref:BRCT domain-containing protein n=1 Tax=Caenorhabditis japonica TaxID=281687 RepID=A0A8R1DGL3_CAEJA
MKQIDTSDEALPATTHCICHTTADGVLESNNFEVLQLIFRGVIIVKEQWMTDCLQNPTLIENDEKYLIHNFDSVLSLATLIPKLGATLLSAMLLKETFNKGSHPYLHAHENPVWILHDNSFDLTEYQNDPDHLFFTISEKEFIALLSMCSTDFQQPVFTVLSLATLIPKLGATLLSAMLLKETFNKGSHPYLHAHENPVWILHDNSFDLTEYQNDPDHLFFTISEKEFIALLFKREFVRDVSKEPISMVTVEDGFV